MLKKELNVLFSEPLRLLVAALPFLLCGFICYVTASHIDLQLPRAEIQKLEGPYIPELVAEINADKTYYKNTVSSEDANDGMIILRRSYAEKYEQSQSYIQLAKEEGKLEEAKELQDNLQFYSIFGWNTFFSAFAGSSSLFVTSYILFVIVLFSHVLCVEWKSGTWLIMKNTVRGFGSILKNKYLAMCLIAVIPFTLFYWLTFFLTMQNTGDFVHASVPLNEAYGFVNYFPRISLLGWTCVTYFLFILGLLLLCAWIIFLSSTTKNSTLCTLYGFLGLVALREISETAGELNLLIFPQNIPYLVVLERLSISRKHFLAFRPFLPQNGTVCFLYFFILPVLFIVLLLGFTRSTMNRRWI